MVQEPDSHLYGLVAAIPRASGRQVGYFSQFAILQPLITFNRSDSGSSTDTADVNNPGVYLGGGGHWDVSSLGTEGGVVLSAPW